MKYFYYTLFILCSLLCSINTQQGPVFSVHSETKPSIPSLEATQLTINKPYQKHYMPPSKPTRMSKFKRALKWIGCILVVGTVVAIVSFAVISIYIFAQIMAANLYIGAALGSGFLQLIFR